MRRLAVLPVLALVACGGSASSGAKDAAADRSSSGGRSGSGGSGSGGGAGAAASGGSSGQVDAAVDATATDAAAPGTGGGTGSSAGAGGSVSASSGGAGGSAPGRGGAGGGAPQATGGAVGASGGGAAAGGASAGGAGGCFPACLDSLAQSCPTTGMCTYAINIQAAGVNFCFANGIKAQNVTLPTNSGPTTSTVKNVDGSLCYTLETTLGNAGILYAWKSPTGAAVATATVANATMNTMVVTCDGASHTVDLDSPGCNGQSSQPSMTNCTLGTCTF